jgi:hypothetical protein
MVPQASNPNTLEAKAEGSNPAYTTFQDLLQKKDNLRLHKRVQYKCMFIVYNLQLQEATQRDWYKQSPQELYSTQTTEPCIDDRKWKCK